MIERIIAIVAKETDKQMSGISAETRLDSLGIDSLEFVCLMQVIQREIGDIPEAEWAGLETVGDVAAACERIAVDLPN